MTACRGPEFCWDDLCVHSDRGICGVWRAQDDFGDDEMYPPDCTTCGDEGVFHEERVLPNGEVGEVITGTCPDCGG